MQISLDKKICAMPIILVGRLALFIIFATMVNLPASYAGQIVGGTVKNPAGAVAGLPIPIPRPIQLKKIQQLSADNTTFMASLNESLESCEIANIRGSELTLRLHYRISPSRSTPIYAGAWLYDANQQAIDAGYRPVALSAFPAGSVDVTLVLPKDGFRSDYLVAFLMESGHPVFVNGRFKIPATWEDGTLSMTNEVQALKKGAADSPALQSKQQFCEDYAKTALAQYNYAIANHLPGIVPPVWSNDFANHYNWCLGVPQQQANQGTALRQGHIEKYKAALQVNPQKGSKLDKAKSSVAATPISIPRPIQAKPGFSQKGPLSAEEDHEDEPVQQMPMHQMVSPGQQIQLSPVRGSANYPKVAPLHPGQKKGFDPGRGP